MPKQEEKTFMVEDATIIFRNFEGREERFNKPGDRNFAVVLDPKFADELAKDGWNVKTLKAREEGEPDTPYIQVAVGFNIKPPRIVLITSNGRTQLNSDNVSVIDWADIETVDLIARAYEWEVNGKTGVKAYLQTMFVTIQEDELERKYSQSGVVA